MPDWLVYVAISTPVVVGLVVLAWGVIGLVTGVCVGQMIRLGGRPYDHERDGL